MHMKYAKAFGLAAMAALALTAFLGASSVSATTLCTQTETPCAAANQYTTTQDKEIEATLETGTTTTLKTTTGSIEDTCSTSTVKGEITNAGSPTTTVAGKVTEIMFGGCTSPTVPNNAAACNLEVHNIAGTDNGTLTGSGCTVTVFLFGVFDCKYGLGNGTHLGTVTGGAMGTIDINAVVVLIDNSPLCPSTAVWEAKYTVTKPTGGMFVEP
jgi:hypothetical protein